jgi:hypothetical protein
MSPGKYCIVLLLVIALLAQCDHLWLQQQRLPQAAPDSFQDDSNSNQGSTVSSFPSFLYTRFRDLGKTMKGYFHKVKKLVSFAFDEITRLNNGSGVVNIKPQYARKKLMQANRRQGDSLHSFTGRPALE